MKTKALFIICISVIVFSYVFGQDAKGTAQVNVSYIAIIAAIVGALITQLGNYLFHRYKERKPKILLEQESTSVFKPFTIGDKLPPVLKITSAAGNDYQFTNLFLSIIHIENDTNKDYETFSFMLTAPSGYSFIHIAETTSGAQHLVSKDPTLDFNSPGTNVNVTLTPFNRKDRYSIKVYSTSVNNNDTVPQIKYDTRFPVDFIQRTKDTNSDASKLWLVTASITLIISLMMVLWANNRAKEIDEKVNSLLRGGKDTLKKLEVIDSLTIVSQKERNQLKDSLQIIMLERDKLLDELNKKKE